MPLSASVRDGHVSVSAGFARLVDSSTARIRPAFASFPWCSAQQETSRYVFFLRPVTALQVAVVALVAKAYA